MSFKENISGVFHFILCAQKSFEAVIFGYFISSPNSLFSNI